MGKGGLFAPPRHKWLADIVSFKNPTKARESVRRLIKGLERGRIGKMKIGEERALTILRGIKYAENRAKAAAKKRDLSAKERREFKKIAEIYDKAYERARKIYFEKYK